MAPRYPDIHVQLSGHDGNAFMVMGLVRRALLKVIISYLLLKSEGDP